MELSLLSAQCVCGFGADRVRRAGADKVPPRASCDAPGTPAPLRPLFPPPSRAPTRLLPRVKVMSYPQGFLFQPHAPLALHSSFGSGLLLGARSEELGRSASGSAFAPYSGPATSPGFGPQLPYGGEPRAAAALSSYVVSARGDGQGSGPGLVPVRTMKISALQKVIFLIYFQ